MLAHSPSLVLPGLVLCLDAANRKSYPTTGTTWTDLSGLGNTGTLVNGVGYNGSNGGSLSFDGVDDYVALTSNSINTNANFSLNFWFKASLTAPGNSFTLLSGITPNGYFQVRFGSSGGGINVLKSYVVDLGTFSGFTLSDNTTYFLTITRSTNTYSLYINGSFVSTLTFTQTFITSTPVLGVNTAITERFAGNIYSFSYYNRALSAAEIKQNYNALKSRYGLT